MAGAEITAEVVEATWTEVAAFSDKRAKEEAERLGREQPDLFEYVLGSTSLLSGEAHGIGLYLFVVIWQIFERATPRKIPRIKAGAIERRAGDKASALARLEGADDRFLERTALTQGAQQPHVLRYMVEAILEAPDDPVDPVDMAPEEMGTLFLVLTTAIELLDEARERTLSGKR